VNGRQPVKAGVERRPGLTALLMTGDAGPAAAADDPPRPGLHRLTWLFTLDALAGRSKAMTDG
jgi:hypothetical protein